MPRHESVVLWGEEVFFLYCGFEVPVAKFKDVSEFAWGRDRREKGGCMGERVEREGRFYFTNSELYLPENAIFFLHDPCVIIVVFGVP